MGLLLENVTEEHLGTCLKIKVSKCECLDRYMYEYYIYITYICSMYRENMWLRNMLENKGKWLCEYFKWFQIGESREGCGSYDDYYNHLYFTDHFYKVLLLVPCPL